MTKGRLSVGDAVVFTYTSDKPHNVAMKRLTGKRGRILDRSTYYDAFVLKVVFSPDDVYWIREDALTPLQVPFKKGDTVIFIYKDISPHTQQMRKLSGLSGKVEDWVFNGMSQALVYHVRIGKHLWALHETSVCAPKDRKITIIRKPLNNSDKPNIIKE